MSVPVQRTSISICRVDYDLPKRMANPAHTACYVPGEMRTITGLADLTQNRFRSGIFRNRAARCRKKPDRNVSAETRAANTSLNRKLDSFLIFSDTRRDPVNELLGHLAPPTLPARRAKAIRLKTNTTNKTLSCKLVSFRTFRPRPCAPHLDARIRGRYNAYSMLIAGSAQTRGRRSKMHSPAPAHAMSRVPWFSSNKSIESTRIRMSAKGVFTRNTQGDMERFMCC
jgi:hypothetical protein